MGLYSDHSRTRSREGGGVNKEGRTNLGRWIIVDTPDALPNLSQAKFIYSDVESTAFRHDMYGSKSHKGHRMAGVGITVDDSNTGWYLPLRHKKPERQGQLFAEEAKNLSLDVAIEFLSDLFGDESRIWINHNLKFDARMLDADGVRIECQFQDTLSRAKVVDQQSRLGGYEQKRLIREWCGHDTDKEKEVDNKLKKLETKDFAELPIDLCGSYCVEDCFQARELAKEIERRKYEGVERIFRMEDDCSKELFKSERVGVLVDRKELDRKEQEKERTVDELSERAKQLGITVDWGSTDQLRELLYKEWNLPVPKWTEKRKESVDEDSLKALSERPEIAGTEREEVFEVLRKLRAASQFLSFYCHGWENHIGLDGRLHPEFNQIVRTGRMSCKSPNAQQLNKEAKELIIPGEDLSFLSRDYSQVEYRLIVAQSRMRSAIRAYIEDPTTDFHQFVADLCGISRDPEAKQINFGISFGMGEPALKSQLAKSMKGSQAEERAGRIYSTYQNTFPEIREESGRAKRLARKRAKRLDGEYGWIATMYGRRRALCYWRYREGGDSSFMDETRKAFNTRIQGTAADIIKDRFIACCRDDLLSSAGVRPILLVHDELLFLGPTDAVNDPEIQSRVDDVMCDLSEIRLPVPLMVSGGQSSTNWRDAG